MDALVFLPALPVLLSLLARLETHRQAWSWFHETADRQAADQQAESRQADRWQAGELPSASILVPVRGLDVFAAANFRSYLRQDYPAPFELIFALENGADPAVPVIRSLLDEHPGRDLRLVFSDPLGLAAKGKIANLIAAARSSQHPLLLLVDADVALAPETLREAAKSLADPGIGLVFAVPTCHGAEDGLAALHNLAVNASALSFAASARQEKLLGAVGSLMATRRNCLERTGGFEALADRLVGIDIAFSRAMLQAGYRLALLPRPAPIQHAHDSPSTFWWQFHRWMVTIRRDVPSFPFVVVLLGIPLWWAFLSLAVALALGRHLAIGLGLVLLVVLADLLSAAVINLRLVHDPLLWRWLWLAPLGELVSLPIFLHSLLSRRVLWRGRWLEVDG
jgi:ceramide glucosyltransferase